MIEKRGGRKAQITVFVILALVIIIVLAIIYFGFIKKGIIPKELKEEPIPEEFKPVKDYVENCIHQIGLEVIKRMGAHGGYINPTDLDLTPYVIEFDPAKPTESDWVSLTGDEEGMIPYYLHVPGKSSYLNYAFGSIAPTIENMEYQLNVFISKNLPICVGTFEELEEKGYEIKPYNEGISTGSFIRDDRIEFFVDYELEVSKGDVSTKIIKFQNTVKFPYKKYHELAVNFMFAELATNFLETFTKALISYHSGVDYTLLPPPLGRTNLPYVVTWSNAKVKQDFQSLLLSYVPAMQVVGTRDYEPITVTGNDLESAFFNAMRLEIYNHSLPDIAITLFCVDQPIYLRVQPSKGDTIKPNIEVDQGDQFKPTSQDNLYQFYYDVAYPVIVEIRGHEPRTEIPEYSFLFALESNIIENRPALQWNLGLGTVDWDYSYINTTFTIPDGSIVTPNGNTVPVKPRSITKSLFCDEDTWVSGDISVKVTDKESAQPLEGATISFGCGDYDECWVGITDIAGEWKGKLPVCQGGYLRISKDGYGSKTIMLSTREGQSLWLGTEGLFAEKEIDVVAKERQIQKTFFRNSSWEWEETTESLGPPVNIDSNNEQLVLTITQVEFEAGTNPIIKTIMFGKDGVDRETISLVPGDYTVTGTLMDYKGFTIPADCSRVCSDRGFLGIGCTDYTYYPEDPVDYETGPWGGVEIEQSTTGVFTITNSDFKTYNEIEFYTLRLPTIPPGCIQHLNELNKIGEYSTKYSAELMPVFK